jgi:hypothetical protein
MLFIKSPLIKDENPSFRLDRDERFNMVPKKEKRK